MSKRPLSADHELASPAKRRRWEEEEVLLDWLYPSNGKPGPIAFPPRQFVAANPCQLTDLDLCHRSGVTQLSPHLALLRESLTSFCYGCAVGSASVNVDVIYTLTRLETLHLPWGSCRLTLGG